MCENYTAYDFMIVRQQLFKFFEDKHLNVSVFNRDEVQKADGTIILDMIGPGPQHSVRPGMIRFFNPAAPEEEPRKKKIDIVHASRWEPHPTADLVNRNQITSRPRLGENIYASDRQPLPVPWKPEVQLTPNNRRVTVSTVAGKATPTAVQEEAKEEESDEEFNLLSDLMGF